MQNHTNKPSRKTKAALYLDACKCREACDAAAEAGRQHLNTHMRTKAANMRADAVAILRNAQANERSTTKAQLQEAALYLEAARQIYNEAIERNAAVIIDIDSETAASERRAGIYITPKRDGTHVVSVTITGDGTNYQMPFNTPAEAEEDARRCLNHVYTELPIFRVNFADAPKLAAPELSSPRRARLYAEFVLSDRPTLAEKHHAQRLADSAEAMEQDLKEIAAQCSTAPEFAERAHARGYILDSEETHEYAQAIARRNAEARAAQCVRVYDNDGETIDRYTVVYFLPEHAERGPQFNYLVMNAHPFHPQGVGQHGAYNFYPLDTPGGEEPPAIGEQSHLGRRIEFSELPTDCKTAAIQDVQSMDETNAERVAKQAPDAITELQNAVAAKANAGEDDAIVCPMRPTINALCENIAAVSCELTEFMAQHKDEEFTGKYRYAAFDGFSGFWIYAAEAGRIYTEAEELQGAGEDEMTSYPEAIAGYAAYIVNFLLSFGYPPTANDLAISAADYVTQSKA